MSIQKVERIVIIDTADPASFYGVNNSNMQLIRNLFPKLRMAARGSVIKVVGDESETAEFEKKIHELEDYCVKYNKLTEEVILDIIHGDTPRDLRSDGVIIYGINGKPISAPSQINFLRKVMALYMEGSQSFKFISANRNMLRINSDP